MERLLSRIVLGAIAPVTLFLAGWWGTFAILGDSPLIPWAAIGGLVAGLVLDLSVFRRHLDSLSSMPVRAQALVAVFYTVMIYGFFMGLPVPLLLVPLGWGFAISRAHTAQVAGRARVAAAGSAALMCVACLATAWLAFNEPSIASQVRGMLGLPLTPSTAALAVGSAIGGAVLVCLAYALPVWLGHRPADVCMAKEPRAGS